MYTLIIDTETTGLVPKLDPFYYNNPEWKKCRIVQIAWELYDENITSDIPILIDKQCHTIKPDDFTIPLIASRIHGITDKIAEEEGVSIDTVFNILLEILEKTNKIVAHNIEFDSNVILSEIYRKDRSDLIELFNRANQVCTMKMGTLPGKKWPKLGELYERLFETKPECDLHRAENDVYICAKIYFKLTQMNKL